MRLFGYILILGLIMGINPVMAKEREHIVQGYAAKCLTLCTLSIIVIFSIQILAGFRNISYLCPKIVKVIPK